MDWISGAIELSERVLALPPGPVDRTGIPVEAMALSRLAKVYESQGDDVRGRALRRRLLDLVLDRPWSLDPDALYEHFLALASPDRSLLPPPVAARVRSREAAVERIQVLGNLNAARRASSVQDSVEVYLAARDSPPVRLFRVRAGSRGEVAFGYELAPDHLAGRLLPEIVEEVGLRGEVMARLLDPGARAVLRAPRHRDHPLYAIVITCCTAS